MPEYNIAAERVRRNIKQNKMAKDLGITPQYLNNIEKGRTEPRRDLMIKIADYLHSDVKELFFQD